MRRPSAERLRRLWQKLFHRRDKHMKKVLEIEVFNYDGRVVFGKVLSQDSSVIKRGDFKFKASNGFRIESNDSPDMGYGHKRLWIKGENKGKGTNAFCMVINRELMTADEYVANLKKAVDELNAKYSRTSCTSTPVNSKITKVI